MGINNSSNNKENISINDSILLEELKLFKFGVEELLVESELIKKLKNSKIKDKPLRIKLGLDPTSSDLHLGHTVVLVKLRQLQDLGHKVILLIGDFTSLIGDPSGRSITRPSLSREEIEENSKTYFDQAGLILNMNETEIKYNSEWCQKLGAEGVINLASKITVARMLERDDFTKRYKAGVSISIHEFLYPLVQGYDSVALKSDLEVGGTDQKFNLLMGRELQRDFGQEPQCILTMPILEGLDGTEKMSKSKNNYIGLTDSPDEMYGKIMSVSDDLMWRYIFLLSLKSREEIEIIKEKSKDSVNPRDIKSSFAFEIVERFYNKKEAENALQEFEKRFKYNKTPTNLIEKTFNGDQFDLIYLLKNSGLVASSSEGFRLIKQGGVRINGEKLVDRNAKLKKGSYILQVGKRKIIKIKIS